MGKKVAIGIGVFMALLLVLLFTLPLLFKDKINAKVKEEINNRVNATIDYGDFSLSLISSFPNFTFSLNDLSVAGIDSFKNDTLAYVKNFNFTVDLMSVISGNQYKLVALNVVAPDINAIVNYDGKANWNIMKPSASTGSSSSSSNFSLSIKKYRIEQGEITYNDKKGGTLLRVHKLDFEGSGDVTKDIYDFATKTKIATLTYQSGGVAYLSNAEVDATINLSIDNAAGKYTFRENSIALNALGLQFDGYVAMPASGINLDVKFKTSKTDFKSILSLIPAVYKKDFDKVNTSGSLALEGDVKGKYNDGNYPAFHAKLKVNNGMFQYPSLPVAVKNIFIDAAVAKEQGNLDLTQVAISKLHLEAGSDPIDAVIKVLTPISDPDVAATISGKLDLANVPKFYPIEGLNNISGMLNMALNFKARKSDLDKKNYANVMAAGNLKVSSFVYDTKQTPMPVRVPDLQMTFNPKNVTLNNFSAVLGKSDITANGTLDNFMAYFFGKGDLSGTLNLKSTMFDANEWLKKDETASTANSHKTADTSKTAFFKVPAHIDFIAGSQFGKILYEKMILENVKGEVVVKDEAIHLNNLVANLLGGSANISAVYNTKNLDHPDVTFTYDIKNFDIQKTYNTVDMAGKLAPVMKHIQGNYSSNLKGNGKLKADMNVDYNSLTGDGKVTIPDARLVDLPVLTKVTEVAKIPSLQNLQLKNAWTVLKFKDGRVNVDPTDLKFGNGYNMHVEGSNGFDQSLDYDMRLDVPSKELGAAASLAQNMLAKIPGIGASMPSVVGFLFKVKGTAAKPDVKLVKVLANGTSTKDIVTNAVDDLKTKAEAEAKQKADELKKQAEDALAKQKADAEQKAREAAEKAKKDAENKLKDIFHFPR